MELNPNHPVTESVRNQWHVICAIIMQKLEVQEIVITERDALVSMDNPVAITVQELPDGIHIKLMTMEEGQRIAREQGGLPS